MPSLSTKKTTSFRFTFFEWIELIGQVAEGHADDRDDDIGNGRPPMQNLNEEFETEIVDKEVHNSNHQVPDNLRSAAQCWAWETDMACHPETCQESDGKPEDKGRNVRREGHETKIEDLAFENEMIQHIIQHPIQSKVESAAWRVTEQFEAHHFAERRIKKVDDRGQGAFKPGFYVFECWQSLRSIYRELWIKGAKVVKIEFFLDGFLKNR